MNRIILAILSIFVCLKLPAVPTVPAWVYSKGALFELRLKVVDQDGDAVSNAKVWGGFTTGERLKDYALIEGFTDSNGEFVTNGRCNEILRLDVTKEGCYNSELKINFWQSKSDPIVVDGKWQPYGEARVIVLKKIKKVGRLVVPDMSRRTRMELPIPEYDCWIPFDLEKFDWVAPNGLGECSDVLLRFRNRSTQRWYDFTDCMDVCFTNNPFAGAYEMKKDMSSDMHTEYEANPKAEYKNFFKFKSEQTVDRKKRMIILKTIRISYIGFARK